MDYKELLNLYNMLLNISIKELVENPNDNKWINAGNAATIVYHHYSKATLI